MRRLNVRRKFIIATGVVAHLVLLAACGDGPSGLAGAPAVGAPELRAARGPGSGVSEAVLTVKTDEWQAFSLPDGHRIAFPARAICDLGASSYGPGEWDQPCVPQTGRVTIVVRAWTDDAGHPQLDFTPRMRFNPAAGSVVLKMRDRSASGARADLAILFCPDGAEACVDESLTDPTLTTFFTPRGQVYWRRVKHFSGYNITSGRSVQVAME